MAEELHELGTAPDLTAHNIAIALGTVISRIRTVEDQIGPWEEILALVGMAKESAARLADDLDGLVLASLRRRDAGEIA